MPTEQKVPGSELTPMKFSRLTRRGVLLGLSVPQLITLGVGGLTVLAAFYGGAGMLLAYSARNRSASIRIPVVPSPKARRIEVRFPDPAANPYLAFAAQLMAGLDGIINKIHPGELEIPVVGITGSVGKTSTKEMIAAVLGQKYNVLKTQGNFNNELGLPLTVFGLRAEHQIAVLEMGISDFGEMHRLAKIARPDTCVITNIGLCHLEFLKSRDGILKAKTEIFDFLKEDGHVILNGDDDKLVTVTDVKGIKPVFFGVENKNGIWADEIESRGLKGIECRIHVKDESFKVLVPIPGRHMVYNALAGTAVGLTYGLTLDEIKAGIESLQSLSGRFHILENEKKNITVIDDCYNANPVSMKASLEVLQDASDGRLVQRLVQPMLDEILLVSSFSSCIFSNFVKHNASALFHTLPTIVSYFLMKNKPLRQLLIINLMAKNYLKSYD